MFVAALLLVVCATPVAIATPFATRVVDFRPAPGQFVNNPTFNDPSRALGPPVGGSTISADNTSVVSLGGFGGSMTLAFDHPLPNRPASQTNPRGLDAIIFGNAVFVGSNPNRRFAECAVIEVSRDANANGLADDPWYLIPGSHLGSPAALTTKTWDSDTNDATYPPANAAWLPWWAPPLAPTPSTFVTPGFALPDLFNTTVLNNPNGTAATTEGVWGYADQTPTLLLGDLNADNIVDNAAQSPETFYTVPDDPFMVGVSPGSGGGDAIDFSWAIDPVSGAPARLDAIDFLRLRTGSDFIAGPVGELSSEIDAAAEAFPSLARSDFNSDLEVNADDLFAFLDSWFGQQGFSGAGLWADANSDGLVNADDLFVFLDWWFARV